MTDRPATPARPTDSGTVTAPGAPAATPAHASVRAGRHRPVEREVPTRAAVEPSAGPPPATFARRIDCSAGETESYWGNARRW